MLLTQIVSHYMCLQLNVNHAMDRCASYRVLQSDQCTLGTQQILTSRLPEFPTSADYMSDHSTLQLVAWHNPETKCNSVNPLFCTTPDRMFLSYPACAAGATRTAIRPIVSQTRAHDSHCTGSLRQ